MENTIERPKSNATELPELIGFQCFEIEGQIVLDCNGTEAQLKKLLGKAFGHDPELARIIRESYLNWEGMEALKLCTCKSPSN